MDPARLSDEDVYKLKHVGGKLRVHEVYGDRIMVRPIKPRTKMDELEESGILHIPDEAKKANTPMPSLGIVVKVGTGVTVPLEEGMAVMFSKYAGTDFMENRTEGQFKLLDVDQVLSTIRAEEGQLSDCVKVERAA